TADPAQKTITVVGPGSATTSPPGAAIGAASRFGFQTTYIAGDVSLPGSVMTDQNDCTGGSSPTPAPTSTVVGIGGAILTAADGALVVQVPPEAVGSDVTFAYQSLPVPPAGPGYKPISAFVLTANGGQITQFAQ